MASLQTAAPGQQMSQVASPSPPTNLSVSQSANTGGASPQTQFQTYTHTVPIINANPNPGQQKRWFQRNRSQVTYNDPWYAKTVEQYPAGYPSLAAYMSDDIDGRIYRRFSYLRNRLLLNMQDKLNSLEQALEDVDHDDEEKAKQGEKAALLRLMSRRYNEKNARVTSSPPSQKCACCCIQQNLVPPSSSASPPPTNSGTAQQPSSTTAQQPTPGATQQTILSVTSQAQTNSSVAGSSIPQDNATIRMQILQEIEETLEKYDEVLLREHEILSIRDSTARQRASFANFIWNGKACGPGNPKKPLVKDENKLIYRKDDSILLGTQEDAWLGTAAESMKRLMPSTMRRYLLADREDRQKSRVSKTEYLTNKRVNSFVKGVVSVASTVLLVLPIIILYALSTNGASGWLKIGILLVFVVAFALALSILTNASRSEMFGASAGYTAVLIVFLTFTGSS